MAQLCLWTKIRAKQCLVLGALAFQCMLTCFLCPKCDKFACLHTRQDQNELHLKRRFFFAKVGIFFRANYRSGNALDGQVDSTPEPIELCMASYQGLYARFVSMMSPKCSIVENDGELMLFLAFHSLVYRGGCKFLSFFFTR